MLDTTARLDRSATPVVRTTYDISWRNSASAPPGLQEGMSPFPNYWGLFIPNDTWGLERVRDSARLVCPIGKGRGWVFEAATEGNIDSFTNLIREHREYLQGLVEQGLISSNLEESAMAVWWRLCDAVEGNLAIPDAAPGADGELFYIWKSGDHYLSLEMSEDGADFYYRDRQTGNIWGASYNPEVRSVSSEIVAKLRLFPNIQ